MTRETVWSCVCQCDCDATTPDPSGVCWTCRHGAHHPSRQVRSHLDAGVREWVRLTPGTGGSSGMSPKQMKQTIESWQFWHARSRCPIPR